MSTFPASTRATRYLFETPLSLDALLAEGAHPESGGLALFGGTVRNHHEGRAVTRLRYTAYAPLAARLMAEIEAETIARFGLSHCRVVHRVGLLEIGDAAIYCVTRAPHRAEAFAGCRHAVDAVKHRVPIWKEEFYADGSSRFVEGCCIDPDHADTPHAHDHPGHHHAPAGRASA